MNGARILRTGAAAVLGLAIGAGTLSASATELRIASGTVSKNALNGGMYKFAELIAQKTDGAYTGKVFPGTLLSFAEMTNGVRDGVVDVGYVIPAYTRAEFPQTNLLIDMSTASSDPVVMAGAINDYMFSCAPCLKEFDALNQVFLGFSVAGPYYLMSTKKIASLDDFRGKTIRGIGPFGRWIEAMGGKSVLVTSTDVYKSLNQGQLDGNTQGLDTLKSMSLGDIVDYVLDIPIGLYLGSALYDVNRDVWDDMTPEHRRAFLAAAAEGHAWTTINYFAENNVFLTHPETGGVEIVKPDEKLAAASAAFREADLDTVAKINAEKYGITDATERVARLRGLVKKWERLMQDVDKTDVAAVAAIYDREIFTRIDPSAL